jgi:hypothetical protein
MPIVYYPTLLKQSQAFEAGLQQLIQLGRIPASLTMDPYTFKIYNLGARDVLANSDLDAAARLLGYRYFAHGDAPEAVVAGDVDASSTPQVTALSYGSSVQDTLLAKKRFDEHPDLSDPASANYEPRLLRIPGLYVEAFWLKPLSGGGADSVIPYHTLIPDLDSATPIPVKEFFDKVRPLAEQALQESDAPKAAPKRITALPRFAK